MGEVGRAVGLQGAVRVWLHNAESDVLEREGTLEIVQADGSIAPARVAELRYSGAIAVVRFDGVEGREAAEALRGASLRVERAELEEPEEGEYYVWDLERCRVTLAGEPLGVVVRVLPYPTCDVLVVRRPDGAELEVPLHESYVRQVRTDEGTIDLVTIDGLGE